jgi:hypothetical protein
MVINVWYIQIDIISNNYNKTKWVAKQAQTSKPRIILTPINTMHHHHFHNPTQVTTTPSLAPFVGATPPLFIATSQKLLSLLKYMIITL